MNSGMAVSKGNESIATDSLREKRDLTSIERKLSSYTENGRAFEDRADKAMLLHFGPSFHY